MEGFDSLTTVLVSLVTVLFSAGAWKFYEKRMALRNKENTDEKSEKNMYRDDLRNRVKKLEEFVDECENEKDEMREKILKLTSEVSALKVTVDHLVSENQRLKNI